MNATLPHISTWALLTRVLREHIRPYRRQLVSAVLCMMVVAAATGANAWMIRPVLDQIFIDKNHAMLLIIPAAVFVIGIIGAAANYGNVMFMRTIGQRVVADMQMRLFSHLVQSDVGLFHQQASGRLISRFTNDINLMRGTFTSVLTAAVKGTLTTIALVGVMFYQDWRLTLIALAAFPIAIHPLLRLSRRVRKIAHQSQAKLGDFTVTLDEIFHGVRTVKSYNREAFETSRARVIVEALTRLYLKASRVQAAASPMMECLGNLSMALVIWYGGMQVLSGHTTPGAFTSFIGAFLMAYKPTRSMSGMGGTLQEGLAAASRLFNVLDTPPSVRDKPGARPLVIGKGAVTYDHVTFRYAPDAAGVEDITLEIPAGKTAALVGLSGGGKSTLMNLLLRFYDVDNGKISIDGQDIRDVTLHSLRQAMAFVPQESMLFDDTVRANIAYGREGASEADIIIAAKNAAADEFIRALPQGYDTVIGAHGVRLSGGQRQRLAIARAMLKNAPILLLDEATSSLDNESERSIQQALAVLMKGRTTLVIAHRLSTIVGADIIYVVENGRIIESGDHHGLMAGGGSYHRLYARNVDAGVIT
ncbi:MAG: ABC transporter ATP-binding protein [Pseudomonadota bacterium]|nr:ABC transporter ATP-binding protein [Pseudomonadota bacterium]MDE3037351.1 ABC transporter ATP-binding protein [Pseudomonadota bacterium]